MINELENIYAPSGMEKEISEYLQSKLIGHCDEIRTDAMGNLHAEKGNADKKPVLVCHMDEPGIIITQITEDGYLKFETVGRVKPEFLVSKRVAINNIYGIISLKAVHLTTKEERKKPVKCSQLLVDIGAESAKRAREYVMPGDCGCFCTGYGKMGDCVKGRALGGRAGCAAAVELMRDKEIKNLHVIFAVQREISCRGMTAASYGMNAEYVLVLDGVDAASPGMGDLPQCGKGVAAVMRCGDVCADSRLVEKARAAAEKIGVKLQICCTEKGGAAAVAAKNGGNLRCLTLGLPIRYAGSVCQVAHKNDVADISRLVKEMLRQPKERV